MSDTHQILEIKLNEIADLLVREVIKKVQIGIDQNKSLSKTKVEETANSPLDEFALLDTEEVALLLKVKKRTIYEWVRTNKIPHKKIGDLLRFSKPEILKWIDES